MSKELFFAIATGKSDGDETLISESLAKLVTYGIVKHENILFIKNNDSKLAIVYNQVLDDERTKGKIVVFTHDDVRIDDMFIKEKLNESVSNGVVVTALAGSCNLRPDVLNWLRMRNLPPMWHIICKDNSGEVAHFKNNNQTGYDAMCFTSRYGNFGPVEFFDGVFMAMDRDALPDDVRFDPDCNSKFHYYDLNFSLNCLIKNVRCETKPIKITHVSHGLETVTDDFKTGAVYFYNRLRKYLNHEKLS